MKRTLFSFLFITVLALPLPAQTTSALKEKCQRENQGYLEQIKAYGPVLDALSLEFAKSPFDQMLKIYKQKDEIYKERHELNKLFNKNFQECINRERSLLKEEEKRIADYNEKVDYFTKKAKELNQIGNRDNLSKKLLDQNLDILVSINKNAFSDLMNELAKFDAEWSSKKRIQSKMYSDMKFLQANSYDASIGDFDNREVDSNEPESSRDNSSNLESELNNLRNETNNISDISEMAAKKRTSSSNNSTMTTNDKGETVGGSTSKRSVNNRISLNRKGTELYRRATSPPYMSNSPDCCTAQKKEDDRYIIIDTPSISDAVLDLNGSGPCNHSYYFRSDPWSDYNNNDPSYCDCLLDTVEYLKIYYCCVQYWRDDLDINFIRSEATKTIKELIVWFNANCN